MKPEFWSDSKTGTLSDRATKLFIGMLNYSDDFGVLEFDMASLKARIFPFEPGEPHEVVSRPLTEELLARDLISEFTHEDDFGKNTKKYLFIRNFNKHQRVDKPGKPLIDGWKRGDTPETIDANSKNVPRTFQEHSENVLGGKGREWKGREGKVMDPPPETDGAYIARVKKFYNEMMEGLYGPLVEEWEKNYSDAVNVPTSLFSASTWLVENPRNRKKNFKKFYGNWLRNQYTRATQPRATYK